MSAITALLSKLFKPTAFKVVLVRTLVGFRCLSGAWLACFFAVTSCRVRVVCVRFAL